MLHPFGSVSQNASLYLRDTSIIKITRPGFNSSNSDYAPCFFKNGIIFTSNRQHALGIKTTSAINNEQFDDLYFSQNNNLNKADAIKTINTGLSEGTASFDSANNCLYYTANVKVKGKIVSGIYSVTMNNNGKWGKPIAIVIPDDTFSYFHPFIFNNGNSILFASDKKGGFGGNDLYKSNYGNNTWSAPENLGQKINTSKDEGYPFVDGDGNLIFSSKGHSSNGGYDIFYSEKSYTLYSTPYKFKSPINTVYDDFALIVDLNKRHGYFSTNRYTNDNDEIVRFDINWPLFKNCIAYKEQPYCFDFTEETSMLTQDTIDFYYEWNFGDGNKKNGLSVQHCYKKSGTYLVDLNIISKQTGDLFLNESNYKLEVTEKKTYT